MFFTTLIATLLGLRSVDKSALDLAKSCGGSSWLTLRKIRFQAALPSIFAGLRIAAPSALLGAIIGEYLGTNSGLGAILIQSQTSFNVTETWGLAVFIAALAGVAYALTSLVARLLLPWAAKGSTVVIGTADRRAAGQSLVSRTGVALTYVVASVALIIGLWYGVIWVLNLNDFFAKPRRRMELSLHRPERLTRPCFGLRSVGRDHQRRSSRLRGGYYCRGPCCYRNRCQAVDRADPHADREDSPPILRLVAIHALHARSSAAAPSESPSWSGSLSFSPLWST